MRGFFSLSFLLLFEEKVVIIEYIISLKSRDKEAKWSGKKKK